MKNEKIYLILLATFFTINLYAQDRTILIFDLVNETLDSINNITYDTTSQYESTPHYIGDFNSNVEILEEETPVVNAFPNSEFTIKRKASLDYDLNSYPLRTSVKIFYIENDSLKDLCSGSMVSKKHVLTAAHCLSEIYTNNLYFDSLIVCPVYDDGNPNSNFDCSIVNKVFIIKDWSISGEDFAVMELEESVGQTTGWIGIGYNETNTQYVDDIFYKFSYPSIFTPMVDSVPYNGDTLYYNYGKVNLIEPAFIGTINTNGIVGESGSSMIQVRNNELYITYGVLTFGWHLRHSKITKDIFYLLKHIIQEDIFLENVDLQKAATITVFPNPTNGRLQLKNIPKNKPFDIKILDQQGKTVYFKNNIKSIEQLDLSNFDTGLYYLVIMVDKAIRIERIIKNGS